MTIASSLNSNQQRAVRWQDGSLLVLAGPGSGKTRVLTTRIARILSESADQRFKVLGLTFTTKAAAEMRERVDEQVPEQWQRVQLTTFHAFAAEVLRQHGSSVGIRPNFTILTQNEDRAAVLAEAIRKTRIDLARRLARAGGGLVLAEAIRKTRIDHPDMERDPKDLMPLLDHRFAQGYDAAQADVPWGKPSWFGPLFEAYVQQLMVSNRADFATLLWLCHRLLVERRPVARQMRLVFRYVCVDEFQDTNLAQYKLLKALVGPSPANLFVVADDDQILYQWNGASPERLKVLRDDYSMDVVQLPESYRCPPDVVELANSLIQHNRARSPGKLPLVAKKPPSSGRSYRLIRFPSENDEVRWIAGDIKARNLAPPSCVVLARTNKLVQAAADATARQGIAAHVTRRKSEFESVPIRWLHAVLRLANERHDTELLRKVCRAWFELVEDEIRPEDVETHSVIAGGDFLREWCRAAEHDSARTSGILEELRRSLVDRVDFQRFIAQAIPWLKGMHESLGGDGFADFEDELSTWKELQARIAGHAGADGIALHQFLQELDLESKAPSAPPDTLRCMTVHGSKGLEFEHVYLIGLAEDQLPSFQARRRGDDSREMEEERRNCFVAITRVESTLTMTYAGEYRGWNKEPSRFLKEMGFDLG